MLCPSNSCNTTNEDIPYCDVRSVNKAVSTIQYSIAPFGFMTVMAYENLELGVPLKNYCSLLPKNFLYLDFSIGKVPS